MKTPLTMLLLCLSVGTSYAEKHSVSMGYATGYLFVNGNKSSDGSPDGMNFKYRYEFNNTWGIVGSFTFSGDTIGDFIKTDWGYTSYQVGPSLRINNYVSLYSLLGIARADSDVSTMSEKHTFKKNALAGSFGLQINPLPKMVIDMGYEYAKFNDYPQNDNNIESLLFNIGVGYRF
ncbi:outer membrane beta-barrel protein [Salmonella enterica subsp. enterica serovar Schwarzengrund]|uniref:Ail/Lom family outer membrane beta-barrel protein n=1 Tax=Salmonella enterica TaxID=28901 RepID=UPI0015FF4848|nr:Ail/Lom family outer membrane beta-barrel protein [Salmonella enterica]EHX6839199.1 outer membrane beta-barrel protein [Salmonella enterica subsp. enterica serovar Muenster]EIP2213730.1 outer membrane beta-barrel protein [Salmonella enterica subsp. enterica serovar Schwarzengrund]EIS1581450.1 outer membrane beta-barrel protein [Salmonella enterica subsp. enterica serovar Brandenburg]ELA5060042.1 outer membrane beta-barrel protein [Salmonella enterica subsp. enterica serovar Brandenburg]EMC1